MTRRERKARKKQRQAETGIARRAQVRTLRRAVLAVCSFIALLVVAAFVAWGIQASRSAAQRQRSEETFDANAKAPDAAETALEATAAPTGK